MKHRWTGALLVAAAFSLGACAPAQSGADGSASPEPPSSAGTDSTDATVSPSATTSESASPSASPIPTPEVDYEY